MSIEQSLSWNGEPGHDIEQVSLSGDYVPTNAAGAAVLCRGILITGATGSIKIDTDLGVAKTIPSGLAVGIVHPIKFRKIYASGTSATGIVAVT